MELDKIARELKNLASQTNYPKDARDLFEKAAEALGGDGRAVAFAEAILREHEGHVLEGDSWPEQIDYLRGALQRAARGEINLLAP